MGCIAVCTSQRLPTAYTSPFGHSLPVRSQTSLQCSVGDVYGQFVYSSVFTVAEAISANWGKRLPEWSVHQPAWPSSGTWAFPGQPLFSTLSCLVCHMYRCSGWTSQGTELEPDTSEKHQVTLTHISSTLKVFRTDKQWNNSLKKVSLMSFRTSVICSSFSSKTLPSLLLKKVATPTISSFLLTIGSDRTFLIFHPVSSTASFCQMKPLEYPDYLNVQCGGNKTK